MVCVWNASMWSLKSAVHSDFQGGAIDPPCPMERTPMIIYYIAFYVS